MAIVIGSARRDEFGRYNNGRSGDQLQTGTPDMRGEVSMQQFYVHSKGWTVIRPKEASIAKAIGQKMVEACNNANIGYDQSGRNSILKDHINSNVPTECDCSSLVRECIIEASGKDPGAFDTSGEAGVLRTTGLFDTPFAFVSLTSTPLYVGDILVTRSKGHTAIVVQANGSRGDISATSVDVTSEESISFTTFENFTPRTVEPIREPMPEEGEEDERDLYYVPIPEDGYSPFYDLTNKSYAWGRFSEVMDMPCNLGLGAQGSWYDHIEDGYERNMAATLGSVMCFSKKGTIGYAAIVESIDPEGVIITSEVDNNGMFTLTEHTKRYGVWDWAGYKFEGFIHNPGVGQLGVAESAMETFIRIAGEHVGEDGSWAFSEVGLTSNNGWSAAFVTACSKVAGSSLNIVVPNVVSCSAIGRVGVLRHMGEWLDGPAQGHYSVPQAGDIVLFRTSMGNNKVSKYDADGAGIVAEANYTTIKVIRGDDGGKVTERLMATSSHIISGYFRPNWDLIDGTSDSVNQYRTIQGLYTNGVSIEDACAREVCYLAPNLKPSINHSKIRLSPINYTGLLGNMYSVFAQSSTSDAADAELVVDLWTNTIRSYYQTDGVGFDSSPTITGNLGAGGGTLQIDTSGNPSIAFSYLKGRGLSVAAVIGIMANIRAESNFNTASEGDHGTSFGICQWHNARGTAMKNFVGPTWQTNLTGQLDYLLYELQNTRDYAKTWSKICTAPHTVGGAQQVADVFVRNFERPANVNSQSITRQGYAKEYWNQLV